MYCYIAEYSVQLCETYYPVTIAITNSPKPSDLRQPPKVRQDTVRWSGLCSRKPESSAGRTRHSLRYLSVGTFNYGTYMGPGPGVLQKNDRLRIFPYYMLTQGSKSRYFLKQWRDCIASPDRAWQDSVASENFYCHKSAQIQGEGTQTLSLNVKITW